MTKYSQQEHQNMNLVADFMQSIRIVPASESAIILYIDQPLTDTLAEQLQSIADGVLSLANTSEIEIVSSYASLLINYNPLKTDHFAIKQMLFQAIKLMFSDNSHTDYSQQTDQKLVELPVYYSDTTGPDLARIATHHKLSVEEVIQIHQQQTYRVFAIGFAPGFGYMGQVDPQIAMPRLATPRALVPKGAVAIADRQTAVYPAASPGGWNIIGQCPILMFNPNVEPSMPFKVGDSVRFKAIDQDTFLAMGGEQ